MTMNIVDVIVQLNQMEADGIIDQYAIGDAVGATFFLEPVATMDVAAFFSLQQAQEGLVPNFQPVFDYLKGRGHSMEKEYVMIGGWPVQFLPPGTRLVEEALEEAVELDVAGAPARVFSAVHLAAGSAFNSNS
jgi:hypothetical protein